MPFLPTQTGSCPAMSCWAGTPTSSPAAAGGLLCRAELCTRQGNASYVYVVSPWMAAGTGRMSRGRSRYSSCWRQGSQPSFPCRSGFPILLVPATDPALRLRFVHRSWRSKACQEGGSDTDGLYCTIIYNPAAQLRDRRRRRRSWRWAWAAPTASSPTQPSPAWKPPP